MSRTRYRSRKSGRSRSKDKQEEILYMRRGTIMKRISSKAGFFDPYYRVDGRHGQLMTTTVLSEAKDTARKWGR